MLTETNFQELISYQPAHPVLSVYINTDPSEGSADAYKLRLRSMLKDVSLADDVVAVENYFGREFDWSGRSVAVFSCAPEGFFRAYSLAVPVRSRVRIGSQPHLKPLADLLDHYGGYGVVLVDKQGARLFSFHLGELQEQEGVMGESVRHTKRGGASAVPGRRGGVAGQTHYAEEVTERNMREIVNFATRFFSEHHVRRVLIAGTDENIALLRNQLPKTWQSLMVGSFNMNMTASKDEVLGRVMQIGIQAEVRQESELLKRVVTGAAKGKGGVLGLSDTLSALHAGRVQILIFQEGYRAPGYHCHGCGYVSSQSFEQCPFCGGSFTEIPDVVDMAVHKVMHAGGEVEVLQHPHKVKGFENVGAILRY